MAQKLLTADEAARMLGISTDQLNAMRDRREVFGIRDGGGWKYKEQEVERVKAEQSGSGSSDDVFELPGAEAGAGDSVLLSEVELGEAGSSLSGGTVIGKPGVGTPHDSDIFPADVLDVKSGSSSKSKRKLSDSDLALAALDEGPSSSPSGKKTGSDVTLVADAAASDSGVKLVAMSDLPGGDMGNTVELELSDLAMDSGSDMPLDLGGGSVGSDIHAIVPGGSSNKNKPGSDLTLDSGALGGDDVLGLDSNVALAEPKKGSGTGSSGSGGGSAIELGVGEFEDDELVLGSHTGSDINDSGISLADPKDSGLSLEQPLQLGGDDMVDGDSGMGGQLTADDEFMLTPAVEMGEEELDESGSQVIALDSEADFDDSAATMLGESLPQTGGMLEEDTGGLGAQPLGPLGAAAAMGGMPGAGAMLAPTQMMVAREAPYSVLNVISLFFCFLFLSLTGMMMWDLLRNMWSWDAPYSVNSSLMDSIIAMFEG